MNIKNSIQNLNKGLKTRTFGTSMYISTKSDVHTICFKTENIKRGTAMKVFI